jgi:hypothetical protein
VISGVVFGLVALGHVARLVYHWPIQIGDWPPVPDWSSWGIVVVAGILCIWAFWLLCGSCCRTSTTSTP